MKSTICAACLVLMIFALPCSAQMQVRYRIQSLAPLTASDRGPYDHRSYSISDDGAVLGQTVVGGRSQASVWFNGTITSLGLWGGGTRTRGYAINNAGCVAAEFDDMFGNNIAGIRCLPGPWISGLYPNGFSFSTPRDLNNMGYMVGVLSTATFYSFPTTAFYHAGVNGNRRPLPLSNDLGAVASAAFAISDSGIVAGNIATAITAERAAIWERQSDTSFTFSVLAGTGSSAQDVNSNERVVGYSTNGATQWNLVNGARTIFNTSGVATGINASNIVVGNSIRSPLPSDPSSRAFVYYPNQGLVYDLTSLVTPPSSWILYTASAITTSGQIVGVGNNGGYLLTPCRAADVNCDGRADSQDFMDFVTMFLAGDISADFNHDGILDSRDFFAFVIEFFV